MGNEATGRQFAVGIDASNVRGAGVRNHLIHVLREARPEEHGLSRVTVWGSAATLGLLPERPWLRKVHEPALDGALPSRVLWQRTGLDRRLDQAGCDLLFVPGSSYGGAFRPYVAMFQNMLPFQAQEARRYGLSWERIRLALLHRVQLNTFRQATGLICLTEYARRVVDPLLHGSGAVRVVIPHGVDERFRCPPRPQKESGAYTLESPFRWLYVSTVDMYKHQWHVADAAGRLRARGVPVAVDFVGPAYAPALRRLERTIERWDPSHAFIRYRGPVPFDELHRAYHAADGLVFASSCENLPNILLEAMAAGLPIACSDREPMPDVLGPAGLYFDPERPDAIEAALAALVHDPDLRARCAALAHERALNLTWHRCARDTFDFAHAVHDSGGRRP